jgi:hypothetical protein
MNEMIERVAKAIYAITRGAWTNISWEEAGDGTQDRVRMEAVAAIEAIRPRLCGV